MERRSVLKAGMVLIASTTAAAIWRPAGAAARVLAGGSRWRVEETPPPLPVDPRQRVFLTETEAAQVSAIFDRLIPADELTASASELGCVAYLDHQLAGSYGRGAWKYLAGPAVPGAKVQGVPSQGDQSQLTPAQLYRQGLAELGAATQAEFGKPFQALTAAQQDDFLERMEAGRVKLATLDSAQLFKQMLNNVQEGFLADPIYGGNRGMAGWKMIGFPGARYDYRDYVQMKGKALDIIPISIAGSIRAS